MPPAFASPQAHPDVQPNFFKPLAVKTFFRRLFDADGDFLTWSRRHGEPAADFQPPLGIGRANGSACLAPAQKQPMIGTVANRAAIQGDEISMTRSAVSTGGIVSNGVVDCA